MIIFSFLLDGLIALVSNDDAFIKTNARCYIDYPHSCNAIHRKCISVVFFFFFLLFFFLAFESSEQSSLIYVFLWSPCCSFFIVLFTHTYIHRLRSNYIIGCPLAVYIYKTATRHSVVSSWNLIYLHLMTCEKLINLSSFVSLERSSKVQSFW